MNIRSKKYTDGAKGQSCVRCGAEDGTVISAHYQGFRSQPWGKGKGVKPHDLFVADLCAECHDLFDNDKVSFVKDPWQRKIDHSESFMYFVLMTQLRRHEQGIHVISGLG